MAAKKTSNATLTRQRNAARKAREEGRWATAIANYTRGLAHKGLTMEVQVELLEGRAACYRETGELEALAADLEALAKLQAKQLSGSEDALRQSRAELEIVSSIAEALSDNADYEQIAQIVGQKVQEFFQAEIAAIGLYDAQAGMVDPTYYYERGELKDVPPFKYGAGVASHVIKTRKPVYLATGEESEKLGAIYIDELPSQTMLMTPIQTKKKVLGVLSIQHGEAHMYGVHELDILTAIANSMAVALENAQLFEESTQRNAELALINSVQAALAEELDIQAIYDTVGEKLRDIFAVNAISIMVYDLAAGTNSYVYGFEEGKRIPNLMVPINKMHQNALDNKQSLLINEGFKEFAAQFGAKAPQGKLPKSNIWVPLPKRGDQVTAVSLMDIDHEHAFSQSDLRLLETLASSMSVALDNARQFGEIQRANQEISEALEQQTATSEVLRALAKSPTDVKPVLEAVAHNAAKLCNADDVQIYRVDGDQLRQMAHFGPLAALLDEEGLPLTTGLITGRAVLEKRSIHIEDAFTISKKDYPESVKLQKRLGHRTALSTPLMKEGQAIGAIVVRRNEVRPFTDSQLERLETLADQAAIAIENVRLFEEVEQRNAELAIINSVGEAMSRDLNVETVGRIVGDKVIEIFDADSVTILLTNQQTGMLDFIYMKDRGKYHKVDSVPIGKGLSSQIIKSLKPMVFGTIEEIRNAGGKVVTGPEIDPDEDEAQSFLGVPIVSSKKALGVVLVHNYAKHAFNERDVSLLSTLALNMGVAIANARLFEETEQRNAELAIINSVGEAMSRNLDVETVAGIVGDKVVEIFKADSVTILLANPQTDMFEFIYDNDRGTYHQPSPVPTSAGLSAQILKNLKPLVFGTWEEQQTAGGSRVVIEGLDPDDYNSESFLGVPIVAGDKAIGVVIVYNYAKHAFSEKDVRLLSTLASNMGVAIENARLFDETTRLLEESRKREDELSTVNTVSKALTLELELDGLIELIGEQVRNIFKADIVFLALHDKADDMVRFPYIQGETLDPIKFGDGIVSRIIQSGEPVLINRDEGWRETERKVDRVGKKAKSYLGVPILVGKQAIGAISVQNTEAEGQFNEADMGLLSTIAANVGAAIRNAQLFSESQRRGEEMETLAKLGVEISQELDLDELLEQIAQVALNSLNGRDVVIRSVEADGSMPVIVAVGDRAQIIKQHVGHIDKGITAHVARAGNAEVVNKPGEDQRIDSIPGLEDEDIGPGIYAPLVTKTGVIGVLSVYRAPGLDEDFTQPELNFAIGLARQATTSIENARLFAELERQKEYFETFFEYSPAAVVVVNFKGEVISWNPAAESLFGYSADEAIGQDVDDLVAKDSRVQAEARSYTKKFVKDLGRVEIRGQRTRKDGTLVDVEVKGLPISVEGQMVGFLVIYHDISEIESARRAAEEANQAKSAFLANMSHELRTPLNAIIGFTRIVRRKGEEELPTKQLENLDKVLVSAEHLLGLINTILDIAKIEAGRMELQVSDFDLGALIEGCLTTTQPLVRADKVKLSKSQPKDLPAMHSDSEKIRQILLNLLSNAAKFTHEGSIKVQVKKKADHVTIAVKDSGIGISDENLHKIFEEFRQADNTTTREYGGTGLGLSISRSLAQLLGGDLIVASEEGAGSTFTLSLPLQLGESVGVSGEDKEAIEAAAQEIDKAKPLVLVIDDQPDMFHILEQTLGDAGYQVVGALGGEEGVDKARELKPFAITLDIMMPQKDGWQVLHELKQHADTKDIPVIILTIVDNKAMGFRLGAADYLMKPLRESSVLEALERLAENSGGLAPRHLLVVDDDPKVVDLVRQTLDDDEFSIASAEDGRAALAQIETKQPDVILLDLIMPHLDGFQFIEAAQKSATIRDVPIIVLTAKSLSKEEERDLKQSVAKIVQKQGLGSDELAREIKKILATQ